MKAQRPKCEPISLEEPTIPNILERAAIAKMLEGFGGIMQMGQRVTKGTTH